MVRRVFTEDLEVNVRLDIEGRSRTEDERDVQLSKTCSRSSRCAYLANSQGTNETFLNANLALTLPANFIPKSIRSLYCNKDPRFTLNRRIISLTSSTFDYLR